MKARQIDDFDNVQILQSNKYKYKVSTHKKSVKGIALILALFLVLIALCTYYAYNINRIKEDSYFILTLDSSSTTVEAEQKSNQIKNAGGSGYIINNGEFLICGAVYFSKDDAQSVLTRLNSEYVNAQIIEYKFKALRLDSELKNAVYYPIKLIDFLINQSLELDLVKTTEGASILLATQKKNEIASFINSLSNIDSKNAKMILLFYNDLLLEWDYLDSLDASFGIYNHRIKYFCCLLIDKYYELRNNLQ